MSVTFEQIQKANETIKLTDVKGKAYAEVNQRVKAFRMVYPCGGIATTVLSNEGGVCVMQATVYDDNGTILGMGTAYEKEGSTYINKTSYIENCETSAVGRALGFAGFGIDTAIASAEEVQNAIANQGGGSGVKCNRCGAEITDTKKRNGELWPASEVIEYSKARYNTALCPACMKAVEAERKAAAK